MIFLKYGLMKIGSILVEWFKGLHILHAVGDTSCWVLDLL